LLPQANLAKLKNFELSHMVLIKHGDLKFIFALQNKSQCQNSACAKFSIRKKVKYRHVGVKLFGFSISMAHSDSLQCASRKKRETHSTEVPKENYSIF